MSRYKVYQAFKDSGIEWIGEVPEHWEVRPLKTLVSHNDDTLSDDVSPDSLIRYVDISSVSYDEGIKNVEELIFRNAPSRARRKVQSEDVVISTVRTYLKAIAFIDHNFSECIFSTGFAVLRPRVEALVSDYLRWMIINELFIQAVESHSEGLSYPAINPPKLVGLKVSLPSKKEQKIISKVLKQESSRIDTLIQKKTRFIELLKEKRQALITHAVTKGLDPNVKMKDSGVKWIGEVPEHWEVKPLKTLVSHNDDTLSDDVSPDSLIRYVDISSVSYDEGIKNVEELIFRNAPSRARRKVQSEDVVISTVRTYLKAIAFIDHNFSECIFSTGFTVLRPRVEILVPDYLKWLILNDLFIQAVESHSEGLSYPAITPPKLVGLKVCLPSKHEQEIISRVLRKDVSRIDKLIKKTQHSIELLKERRSAFITAAVTGQVDLRGEKI